MAAKNKCLAQSNNSCMGGGKGDQDVDLPMNGGSTPGWAAALYLLLPLKTSRLRTRTAPLSSDLPIRGRPGMNPSHHSSDEQMFGAAQQVLHRGLVD